MSRTHAASTGAPRHEDDVLIRLVSRCRQRACMLLFVQYAAVAAAAAAAAAAVLPYVWTPEPPNPRAVALLLGLLVVGGSAAAAVWRRPSLTDAAAAIDRRLRLDDSVVAALQVRGTGSPIAPLVVRHAVRRTADVRTADVVSMSVRVRVLVAACAATPLLVLLGPRPISPSRELTATAAPLAGAGAVLPARGEGSPESSTAAVRDGRLAARAALPISTPEDNSASSGGDRAAPDASRGAAAGPGERARVGADTPASARGPAPGTGGVESPDRTDGTPLGRSGRGDAGAARTQRGEADAASGHVADTVAGGEAVAGSAAGSAANPRGGAGGVAGGRVLGNEHDTGPVLAGRARAGGRAASTAGAASDSWRDDVPPDLRSYVQSYLRAVRAGQAGR